MLSMDAHVFTNIVSTWQMGTNLLCALSAGNVRLGYQVWEQSSGACWILWSRDLGPTNS